MLAGLYNERGPGRLITSGLPAKPSGGRGLFAIELVLSRASIGSLGGASDKQAWPEFGLLLESGIVNSLAFLKSVIVGLLLIGFAPVAARAQAPAVVDPQALFARGETALRAN